MSLRLRRRLVVVSLLLFLAIAQHLHAQVLVPVWPMTGHDPQRTGRSSFVGPTVAPSAPDWTFSSGAPIVGDVAVSAAARLYFVSDKLYALNPDGTLYAAPVLLNGPITGPAVDDANNFAYVIVTNPTGGFDVTRYSTALGSPQIIYHGSFAYNAISPTPLIVGPDGTVYFSDGISVIAVGPKNWATPGQPNEPCFGNPGFLTPAVAANGNVYAMCQPGGGSAFGSGVYAFDGNTGAQTHYAFYSRGGTEPIIDSLNHIRAGYQAFNGVAFCGDYTTWDSSLNQLTPSATTCDSSKFTTSRAALFPDGVSTVRIRGQSQRIPSPCLISRRYQQSMLKARYSWELR
jgi:hypothetical protein